MRPGVTLAMIVRNEGANLRRCLESVRPAVDAIAIVDTGSQDDTVAIARSFGAMVESIEWPDSFAEARNRSLKLVETEWVLWLDADEWFVDGHARFVHDAVQDGQAFGFLMVRRDLFPGGGHSEQQMLRLWRHHPNRRFRGAIHEHIPLDDLASAHPGKVLKTAEIAFWHDGYSAELSLEKARRNLPLLRREIAEGAESMYYEFELAQTLKSLGEQEGHTLEIALADRLISMRDRDEPPDNTVALFLMRYLADLADAGLRDERTEWLLRLGRGWFPDHPGVRSAVAQVEIRRGQIRTAFDDLREVERMAETGEYDRLTSTHPAILGEALSTNLALVAHQLGKRDVARKHYERLLQFDPNHPIARQNLPRL